jgi:hypothetical protein
MPIFKFKMITHMVRTEIYTVKADSLKEAREKAYNGETEQEEFIRDEGIEDRSIEKEL